MNVNSKFRQDPLTGSKVTKGDRQVDRGTNTTILSVL